MDYLSAHVNYAFIIGLAGLLLCCTIQVHTSCPSGTHIKPANIPDWLAPRADYLPGVKHYQRYCQDLKYIPSDIPFDVVEMRIFGNPIRTIRELDLGLLFDLKLLDLAFNEISHIEKGALVRLTGLEQMNLFENRLTQIIPGIFTDLPSLWRLDIDANAVHTVHPGALALSGLPAIKQLTLHDNVIVTLPWNVFSDKSYHDYSSSMGNRSKLELILSDNPMICNCSLCGIKQAEEDGWLTWWGGDEHAPECSNYVGALWASINLHCNDHGECACPSGDHIKKEHVPSWLAPNSNYTRDKKYNMICQGLERIPPDMPRDAVEVGIRGNPIKALTVNDFKNLQYLKYLALGWNEIISIENNTFSHLGAVEKLFLHDNKLTHLQKGIFTGLRSLKVLSAFRNYIHTISTGALAGLPSLIEVTLGENALTSFPISVFSEGDSQTSTHPTILALTLNQNPMICNCTLCWLKEGEKDGWLTWWGGNHNAPQCSNYFPIPWSDVNLKCNYHGQCDRSVDDNCPPGDHIKPENIPDWLKPNATYVDRHFRRFCQELLTIPTDIPSNALEVKIYGNPIKSLQANAFKNLSEATVMSLGWNEINQIAPQTFTGLRSVKQLYLHDNKLSKLHSGTFLGLPRCIEVMLHFNFIDTIDSGTFSGLDLVEVIHLHDNRLTQLKPGMLTGLRSLKLLTLFKNSLHTIHSGSLSELPQLSYLGLGANGLTTFPWTAFVSEKSVGSPTPPSSLQLQLLLNPFHCNVSMCWVREAEQLGWLTWWNGEGYAPHCHNYPGSTWSSINLDCKRQGECNNPAIPDCSNQCHNSGELYADPAGCSWTYSCRCNVQGKGTNEESESSNTKMYAGIGVGVGILVLIIVIVIIVITQRKKSSGTNGLSAFEKFRLGLQNRSTASSMSSGPGYANPGFPDEYYDIS